MKADLKTVLETEHNRLFTAFVVLDPMASVTGLWAPAPTIEKFPVF